MGGFEVRFNVYANTQEEADLATAALKAFISEMAQNGIAVTANKITSAVKRWQNNVFVTNYFK